MSARRFFLSRAVAALFWCGLCLSACSSPSAPPVDAEPPIASAGQDQSDVPMGSEVTLDGSDSSDPEGQSLTYQWTAADDNPALVILAPQARITFVLSVPGEYVFLLTVEASGGRSSEADAVRITVSGAGNQAPVAHAGVNSIYPLDAVIFLDGTSSTDAEGDSLSFLWELVSGTGSVAFSDSSASQPSLTVTADGLYTFRLTVSDQFLSDSDEVIVEVDPADNVPPQASAGSDREVPLGTVVILDGTGSFDPDAADTLSFHWTVGRTPGEGVELADSTTATPSFTPGELGEYAIGLVVIDDSRATSIQDVVTITVVAQDFNTRAGMVEVPAGSFTMGSDVGNADERPVHTVDLSAFWFDSVEATTAQYQLCVDASVCSQAGQSPGCNAAGIDRDDHPINCVDWNQANTFCTWARKRLPTEAEWEKAARGEDKRIFPWGDDDPNLLLISDPTLQLLNHANFVGTTVPVGEHPDGVSFYGAHNMAGNVMEWTADIFDRDYYAVSPVRDPQGPAEGPSGEADPNRVARGGHWQVGFPAALTATVRNNTVATRGDTRLGFRCASTDPP